MSSSSLSSSSSWQWRECRCISASACEVGRSVVMDGQGTGRSRESAGSPRCHVQGTEGTDFAPCKPGPGHHHRALIQPLRLCIPPLPTLLPHLALSPLCLAQINQSPLPACLHDAFRCRRYDALTAARDGPLLPGTSVLIAAPVTAGTNPIHNKKAKKKVVEEDEDDKAFKAKMLAGGWSKCAVWNKGTI